MPKSFVSIVFSQTFQHTFYTLFFLFLFSQSLWNSYQFGFCTLPSQQWPARCQIQWSISFSSYMIHQLQWLTWAFCFQDITVLSSLLHHCILPLFLISTYYYLQEFSFLNLCLFSYTHTLDDLIYLMFLNTIFTMMTACNLMTPSFITIILTSPLKTKLTNSTVYVTLDI